MTHQEVIAAIDNARKALNAYKQERQSKTGSARDPVIERIREKALEESIGTLIKESWEAGMSGKRCSRCGGTGREA